MTSKNLMNKRELGIRGRLRKMMKCICSGEQMRMDEIIPSSESLATRDYSASGYSSRAGENEKKPDTCNIEEAESSLRESGFLNYEVSWSVCLSCLTPFHDHHLNPADEAPILSEAIIELVYVMIQCF